MTSPATNKLVRFAAALMALEVLPAYAVTPLLPHYVDRLGLSETEVGIVAGAYAAGTVVASIPIALLARQIGVKRGVVVGLAGFSLATVAFGLAGSFPLLFASRFIQGVAGAMFWTCGNAWVLSTSLRERRGEVLGALAGATAIGSVLGPILGGVAVAAGPGPAFGAIGLAALILASVGLTFPAPPLSPRQRADRHMSHGQPRFDLGLSLWLVAMPATLVGAASVAGPLTLGHLGWNSGAIVLPFLAAAVVGVFSRRPVGRMSDRRGRMPVIRPLLAGAAVASLALAAAAAALPFALVLVCALSAFGLLWGPTIALAADVYERLGFDPVMTFGIVNVGAGLGISLGSTLAGAVTQYWSSSAAFVGLFGLCAGTLVVISISRLGEGQRT